MKKILISIFFLSNISVVAQVGIKIITADNTDQGEFSIIGDTGNSLLLLKPHLSNGYLIIDTIGIRQIEISHISFKDTIIEIKKLLDKNIIQLQNKVLQLNDIIVTNRPTIIENNLDSKKHRRMYFGLSDDSFKWYLSIDLFSYNLYSLSSLSFKFKNINIGDTLIIEIYQNKSAIFNKKPLVEKAIIKTGKNDMLGIDDFGDINLQSSEFIFISFKLNRKFGTFDSASKKFWLAPAVLTKFQDKETAIYLGTKDGILNKHPMEQYKENFNAYPQIAYIIKYKKK